MKEVIKKIQDLETQKIVRLDLVIGGNATGVLTDAITCTPAECYNDIDYE